MEKNGKIVEEVIKELERRKEEKSAKNKLGRIIIEHRCPICGNSYRAKIWEEKQYVAFGSKIEEVK